MTVALSAPWMSVKANSAIDMSTIMPFIYQGLSYLPLGGIADLIGAPLQWDAANGKAVMNYQGEDLVLKPNSLKGMFAGQPVTLPSAPVVVNGVTYVPASVLKKYYNIPVSWDRNKSEVTIKGPNGWKKMKANTRPPWHNGPPPWAPAWGARRNAAYGHSNVDRAYDNRNSDGNKSAFAKRGNENRNARKNKSDMRQRGYGSPGNTSDENRHRNGKEKGNKKND